MKFTYLKVSYTCRRNKMRREFRYITEDGSEFYNEEEALAWESSLDKEAKDFTFKHDYQIGEIVYTCCREHLWECRVDSEEFEITSWFDDKTDTEIPKAKFNTLYLVSTTDSEEYPFTITSAGQLRWISRNIKDLLKVRPEVIDNLFK